MKKTINKLHESLNQRKRPEDIAELILQLKGVEFTGKQKRLLERAAKGSLKRRAWYYTSMLETFLKPTGAHKQVTKANELFRTSYELSMDDCENPDKIEAYIEHISSEIHKTYGQSDYKADRLNREKRIALGLDISRRRYNKLFRHLARLEFKLLKLLRELKKHRLTKIGKSGLAHMLDYEEFRSDPQTAVFIAYFSARNNLRSEFTIFGQQRAFDEIASMLFSKCEKSKTTNWWAIAHVFPRRKVLAEVDDEKKGLLLGQWFDVLQHAAQILEETWEGSNINRQTMIVRKGNDSSTWNNSANAWNTARNNWLALLYAMGLEDMLDHMCLGKVLRLMAADVVAWHMSTGGELDPDTNVWNELPLPWKVISGKEICTKSNIEQVCEKYGVDPEKKGWILPRTYKHVFKYKPTPELVHGVSVSNPHLATLMRASGFFSGKSGKQGAVIASVKSTSALHKETLNEHHERLKKQTK